MAATETELASLSPDPEIGSLVSEFERVREENASCGGGHPALRREYRNIWYRLAHALKDEPGREHDGYKLDLPALAITTPKGEWTIPGAA